MLQRAASFAMVVVLPAPVGPTTAMTPPLTVLSWSTTGRCLTSSASGMCEGFSRSVRCGVERGERHGDIRRDVHGRQFLQDTRLQRFALPLIVPRHAAPARSRAARADPSIPAASSRAMRSSRGAGADAGETPSTAGGRRRCFIGAADIFTGAADAGAGLCRADSAEHRRAARPAVSHSARRTPRVRCRRLASTNSASS